MKAAKDLGVEQLAVFGDVELVVQQVKKIYQVKQYKLRNYRNEVWDLVEHYFFAFNLSYISRETNQLVDSLAMAASNFKVPLESKVSYEIHIKNRPFIPDNIKHWQVFEDDQQVQKFMECFDEFSESQIDEDEESSENDDKASYKNMIAGQEIIDLKTNHIPRGLVPLERLFDSNDVCHRSDGKVEAENTVDCNIGTSTDPKNVKISKSIPT